VDEDVDYDPRKPEYIRTATEDEVENAQEALIRHQIAKLESVVSARPISQVTRHYHQVAGNLRESREGKLWKRRLEQPTIDFGSSLGPCMSLQGADPAMAEPWSWAAQQQTGMRTFQGSSCSSVPPLCNLAGVLLQQKGSATCASAAVGAAHGRICGCAGAIMGTVLGFGPAPFTLGLSIPLGAVAGLCVGAVLGGSGGGGARGSEHEREVKSRRQRRQTAAAAATDAPAMVASASSCASCWPRLLRPKAVVARTTASATQMVPEPAQGRSRRLDDPSREVHAGGQRSLRLMTS